MKKYQLTFKFFETEKQVKDFCEHFNKSASYYIRKNKPAHYTPWEASDGKGNAHFIAWYVY